MINRERIYAILVNDDADDKIGIWYNRVMVILIVGSMVPLWFKGNNIVFIIIDTVCVTGFIIDYILRFLTADYALGRGKASFAIYPFTPMAIVDLLSILPSFIVLNPSLRTLRVLRVLRALRAFRLIRYTRGVHFLLEAVKRQRQQLLIVFILSVVYVVVCATVMFNVEPNTFNTFTDALYWAAISLTTVGYGDIHPLTEAGRIVTMISSLVGVAVIALPASILTIGLPPR